MVLPCPITWDLHVVKRNWDNMLREADQVSRARYLPTAQKKKRVQRFLRALGLPLPSKRELIFLFLNIATAAGDWTVKVCMVCSANTVLLAFDGIREA